MTTKKFIILNIVALILILISVPLRILLLIIALVDDIIVNMSYAIVGVKNKNKNNLEKLYD